MSLFVLAACSTMATKAVHPVNPDVDYLENPVAPPTFTKDTLVKISAAPEKGFNFGYYLSVPGNVRKDLHPSLYVEPNNTGTANDDLAFHDASARRFIERSYSHGIAVRLGSPMLVPIFPRPESRWQEYTHYLNRRTLKIPEGPLKRIDLQLCAMIENARTLLAQSGIKLAPKILMNGFSSSAGFTLRFTALHPDLVQATAAGGINALPILPLKTWKGQKLPYPVGIEDLKKIAGSAFNADVFLGIPQKLYMGALDSNDTVPFRDAWDEDEANFIRRNFGEKMMPDRWEKIQKIYKSTKANVVITTYPGVGHQVTPEIEEDIFQFFSTHRQPGE